MHITSHTTSKGSCNPVLLPHKPSIPVHVSQLYIARCTDRQTCTIGCLTPELPSPAHSWPLSFVLPRLLLHWPSLCYVYSSSGTFCLLLKSSFALRNPLPGIGSHIHLLVFALILTRIPPPQGAERLLKLKAKINWDDNSPIAVRDCNSVKKRLT